MEDPKMHTSARVNGVGQSALQSASLLREPNRVLVQQELEKLLAGSTFWDEVAPKMESGELSVPDVRELVRWGLMLTDGDYNELARLFNLPQSDSERFVGFLEEWKCHLDYTPYGHPIEPSTRPIWTV